MPSHPALVTDPEVLGAYLRDASNTAGRAEGLLRPRTAEELADQLAWCQEQGQPLTVTARRTSTTGAPVPQGGWLLSTEHLDRVLHIGEDRAVAEAGVLLGVLQDQIEAQGRLFPPDPTSRGECSLGGAIACNASGARSYRYGPTRRWVQAVQVALPDGRLIEATRHTPIPSGWPRLRWTQPEVKTAAGLYPAENLLDLFIGQEGILGVITRAELVLTALPERVFSVLAWFGSSAEGLELVEALRSPPPGVSPRCVEWYDRHSLDLARARLPELPVQAQAAVWCEQECTDGDFSDRVEAWAALLEGCGAMTEHTLFADDEAGQARLRALRHAVPAGVNEQLSRTGMPKVATDFAVPDAALRPMMAAYEAVKLPHILFGHIGDNHLHLNLLPRDAAELAEARRIWAELFQLALSFGGTVSAEHGVGKLKRRQLAEMVGPEVIASFVALKQHLDPRWILGRDTMIDAPV